MKNFVKNLGFIMICLIFVTIIGTNIKSVYADSVSTGDGIITVKFVYVRADNRYSDFYMKVFLPSTTTGDVDGPFMIIDGKALFECKLQKNMELDEVLSYRVMEKTISEAVIKGEIDISGINSGSIDVVINGDSGDVDVRYYNKNGEIDQNFENRETTTYREETTTYREETTTLEENDDEEVEVNDSEDEDVSSQKSNSTQLIIVLVVLVLMALGLIVVIIKLISDRR